MRRVLAPFAALVLVALTAQAALAATPAAPVATPSNSTASSPSPSPSPSATAIPRAAASPSPSPLASPNPSPSASPSSSASPSPSPSATPDPDKPLYDKLEARLGGDLAQTLAIEQRLNSALDRGHAKEAAMSARVDAEAGLISDLQDQVSKLDDQISSTQDEIATQQAQVAGLARAMARRPTSWLVLLARAGSLHEALVEAADLIGAAQHAHAVQARLQADLDKLNADRQARQADLDRESATKDALDASLTALQSTLSNQDDIAAQLMDLEAQLQDAISGLRDQAPDVAADLAKLLESQRGNLDQAARDLAWGQAQIGSGRLLTSGLQAAGIGSGPANLKLAWPEPGAPVTQPFGPSDLILEPPLGSFPHFHTGMDIADVEFTPVLAAADGVVVAAATGRMGYGNYVVVDHGSGVETLYGHLSEIKVAVGDRVKQGQPIALEGSSGFSTGPHLHFELRNNGQFVDPLPYLPLQKAVKKP